MKVDNYLCDLCGEAIRGDHIKFYAYDENKYCGIYDEMENHDIPHEICPKCAGTILSAVFREGTIVKNANKLDISREFISKMAEIEKKLSGGVK